MPRDPSYYLTKMEELRQAWGGHCIMCGTQVSIYDNGNVGPLEFAHLPGKPTGLNGRSRGKPERYHDIRKHPGSYVLLCCDCHVELDRRGGSGSRATDQMGDDQLSSTWMRPLHSPTGGGSQRPRRPGCP